MNLVFSIFFYSDIFYWKKAYIYIYICQPYLPLTTIMIMLLRHMWKEAVIFWVIAACCESVYCSAFICMPCQWWLYILYIWLSIIRNYGIISLPQSSVRKAKLGFWNFCDTGVQTLILFNFGTNWRFWNSGVWMMVPFQSLAMLFPKLEGARVWPARHCLSGLCLLFKALPSYALSLVLSSRCRDELHFCFLVWGSLLTPPSPLSLKDFWGLFKCTQ